MSALARALAGEDEESSGLLLVREREILGLILFGWVAGALGTAKVHFIAVTAAARLRGLGTHLFAAALETLRAAQARMLIAEVPDDPVLRTGVALLERCGFVEEGRVADFYRDGVDLRLLRLDLPGRDDGELPA